LPFLGIIVYYSSPLFLRCPFGCTFWYRRLRKQFKIYFITNAFRRRSAETCNKNCWFFLNLHSAIFLLFLSDYFSATIHLLDLLKNIGCTLIPKVAESIQNCLLISLPLHKQSADYVTKIVHFFKLALQKYLFVLSDYFSATIQLLTLP